MPSLNKQIKKSTVNMQDKNLLYKDKEGSEAGSGDSRGSAAVIYSRF